MDAVTKIKVNDREYTVHMFDPMTAFDFFHALSEARMSGKGMAPLARRAIGQCRDAMMKDLSEEANFTACFSQYPEDMIPLQKEALEALTSPFMKGSSVTTKTVNN